MTPRQHQQVIRHLWRSFLNQLGYGYGHRNPVIRGTHFTRRSVAAAERPARFLCSSATFPTVSLNPNRTAKY